MEKYIEELRSKVIPILKQHGVVRASVFGSFVRREMKEGSDIDILIELPREKSLLDFVALKLDLEDVLGRKVDLVEYSTIHPLLRERILEEQVPVL